MLWPASRVSNNNASSLNLSNWHPANPLSSQSLQPIPMILAWYRFHPCVQCVLKVVLNLDDAGQFRVISVCDRSKGSMQTVLTQASCNTTTPRFRYHYIINKQDAANGQNLPKPSQQGRVAVSHTSERIVVCLIDS